MTKEEEKSRSKAPKPSQLADPRPTSTLRQEPLHQPIDVAERLHVRRVAAAVEHVHVGALGRPPAVLGRDDPVPLPRR